MLVFNLKIIKSLFSILGVEFVFDYVIDYVHPKLPKIRSLSISKKHCNIKIQEAVETTRMMAYQSN